MNKKSKQYPSPRFKNIEEEDKYWETHSPLDEGFEGEVETSKQKRSSFLSVRMTGDELSKLRDAAAKLGLGPSTYARLILTQASSLPNWPIQYPFNFIHNLTDKPNHTLKRPGICILDIDDININQDIISSMLVDVIRNVWKCRMVTPDDADYEKVETLVRTKP